MQRADIQSSPQVNITRTYPVSAAKVWRAWTEPQALKQWFCPGSSSTVTAIDVDLSPGGRFRIAFQTADGTPYEASGVYEEVDPERRLVFSWAWKRMPERVSRIIITLKPIAEGTELSFLHERLVDAADRAGHQHGWSAFFENLDAHLLPQARAE